VFVGSGFASAWAAGLGTHHKKTELNNSLEKQIPFQRLVVWAQSCYNPKPTHHPLRLTGESVMVVFKAAIAGLTKRLRNRRSLSSFLDDAVQVVHSALNCDFVKILEHVADRQEFVHAASRGWSKNKFIVPATPDTHAGFTILSGRTVYFADLQEETRFTSTDLRSKGVRSGAAVVVESGHGQPAFGLMLCHSKTVRHWGEAETQFLEDISGIISIAISKMISCGVFDSFREPIVIVNEAGNISDFNFTAQQELALDWKDTHNISDLISDGDIKQLTDGVVHQQMKVMQTKILSTRQKVTIHVKES
jgi:hypothetical protein